MPVTGYRLLQIGSGEDAPLTSRGIRDLWIIFAVLAVPVGIVVYFAVKTIA